MTLYKAFEKFIASPRLVELWEIRNSPSPWKSAEARFWVKMSFLCAGLLAGSAEISLNPHLYGLILALGCSTMVFFVLIDRGKGSAEARFVADAKALQSHLHYDVARMGNRELEALAKRTLKGVVQKIEFLHENERDAKGEEVVLLRVSGRQEDDLLKMLYDLYLKFSLVPKGGYGYLFIEVRAEKKASELEKAKTPPTEPVAQPQIGSMPTVLS